MSDIDAGLQPLYSESLVGADLPYIEQDNQERIVEDNLRDLQPYDEGFAIVDAIRDKFMKGCMCCLVVAGAVLVYLVRNNASLKKALTSLSRKQILIMLALMFLFSYSFSQREAYNLVPMKQKKKVY